MYARSLFRVLSRSLEDRSFRIDAQRNAALRRFACGVALAAAAAAFAGCSGGAGGGGGVAPGGTAPAQSQAKAQGAPLKAPHALGFIRADAATLARITKVRSTLTAGALPAAVDLSSTMPQVGDQGQEGSCVSWAVGYELRGYEARRDIWSSIDPKRADPGHNFSPAFLYNQVNGGQDLGSTFPANFAVAVTEGVATLADMPYTAGDYTATPSPSALKDALNYTIKSWGFIDPGDPAYLTTIKGQLAAGNPVIIGFRVYDEFMFLTNGQVVNTATGTYWGNHGVTLVGYDDSAKAFKLINSWGPYWGSAGFGYISYGILPAILNEAYTAIDNYTPVPTPVPTQTPIATPTPVPTQTPIATPTPVPTQTPIATPTPKPTQTPIATPTPKPTQTPIATPTPKPTQTPIATPTPKPTQTPIATPTPKPTQTPIATPTPKPTQTPIATPTPKPTATPKPTPTPTPTPAHRLGFTSLTPSYVSTNSVGYQPTLTAAGSGFTSLGSVTFTQTGATNAGPWIWKRGDSNWNGKVSVNSDGSLTLRPVVTRTGDSTGYSTWTVRLTDSTNASLSRTFTLQYTHHR